MWRIRVSLLRTLLRPQTLTPRNPSLAGGGGAPPLRWISPPLRSFAASACEASKIRLLGSAEDFDAAVARAKDDKVPAIFYFTAAWCGPCRVIAPTIEELNKNYPNVTTYKIDIDQEGLGTILNQLRIFSVPTFHFYNDGKIADEMVGADVNKLKETMEKLYK